MKTLKATMMILLYSVGMGAIIFGWQLGIHYLSSPHSEVLQMEMHELSGGPGMQGV